MQKKSSDIRKEEIKSAVFSVIKKSGLKGLSTKNIAKEVGISEGGLFRHFPSKKAIIQGIMEDVINDMIETLRTISLGDKTPEERLFKYLCKTISYLTKHHGITMLMFTEASYQKDNELLESLNHIFNSQKELVSKIVTDGINEGIWREDISISDFATVYMGIPITLNIEIIMNKKDFNSKGFCERMFRILINVLEK